MLRLCIFGVQALVFDGARYCKRHALHFLADVFLAAVEVQVRRVVVIVLLFFVPRWDRSRSLLVDQHSNKPDGKHFPIRGSTAIKKSDEG